MFEFNINNYNNNNTIKQKLDRKKTPIYNYELMRMYKIVCQFEIS